MSVLRNKVFLGSLFLFILNQGIQLLGWHPPFIHAYLDDFLCLPIVLTIILFVHRVWRVRDESYVLPAMHIVAAVIFYSVFFELIYPLITTRGTADMFDMIAYSGGAVLFGIFINIA